MACIVDGLVLQPYKFGAFKGACPKSEYSLPNGGSSLYACQARNLNFNGGKKSAGHQGHPSATVRALVIKETRSIIRHSYTLNDGTPIPKFQHQNVLAHKLGRQVWRHNRRSKKNACEITTAKGGSSKESPQAEKDKIYEGRSSSWVLRGLVDGLTEILNLSGIGRTDDSGGKREGGSPAQPRSQAEGAGAVTSDALRADYEQRAYFITGNITEALYSEDCFFGDPTVSFTGLQRWRRNIRLLVPFFEEPSVALHSIVAQDEEGGGRAFVTQWRLRTYLKFPWRPLIDIDGSTKHSLDETNTKVVRHVESWGVSAIEALGQMFVASDRALWSRSRARSPSGSPKK